MQGIIKRIGFVRSRSDGVDACFMLEGDKIKYDVRSSETIALTKVGDEVKFEPNSGFSKFLEDTNVNNSSFRNLTLEREI